MKIEESKFEKISEVNPILITGCARSGTSLVGGIINICGAFGGKMSGSNRYNMKGMFENAHIRDKVEKPYLREMNVDHLGQKPILKTEDVMIPNSWRRKIHSTMLSEGYEAGPWFYKGAKACQIWPVWHHAFPNAKWLIVRRRSAEIAMSCMNTAFMQRYRDYDGWIEWIHIHEQKWREMYDAGLNIKVVWPDRMVRGDYSLMKEAIEWLGLEWKHEEVINFVDPKLYKSREKLKNQ